MRGDSVTVVEFGKQNEDTVLLLHGGGLSWWNYREAARLLEAQYHVVLPVLDGHADSDAPFTSIEDNATGLISYIDTHLAGKFWPLAAFLWADRWLWRCCLSGKISVNLP